MDELSRAEKLLDLFIDDLESVLRERISINDHGVARTVVDSGVKPLAVDARKTVTLAKTLFKQILSTKRQAVTSRFLKYFRLVSENSRKVAQALTQAISDGAWLRRAPRDVTKKGVLAVDAFTAGINDVIGEVNERILSSNEKISLVPPVRWKFVRATNDEIERRQRSIRMRDYVQPSKLFEETYKLSEKVLPTQQYAGKFQAMKRLQVKGYQLVILGNDADRELPDVHGRPPQYDTYGRGGKRRDGSLFMEGGPQGSRSGHPTDLEWGFYWGTRTEKTQQGEVGLVFVRGRAGVSENDIVSIAVPIVDWISKVAPKV
jgi:hypothetical protein